MKREIKKNNAAMQQRAVRKQKKEQTIDQLTDQFKDYLMDLSKEEVNGHDLPEIVESLDRESLAVEKRKNRIRNEWKLGVLGIALAGLLFCPFSVYIDAYGTVQPERRSILTAPFDGSVEKADCQYGDGVQAGATILVFNARDEKLELQFKQKEREITQAQIAAFLEQENHLNGMLERKRKMAAENLISLEEMDRYQLELDRCKTGRMDIQKQQVELETRIGVLENKIQTADVKSTVSGVVLTQNMRELENQFILKGEKICEIADGKNFLIQAEVLEKQYRKIRIGQRVKFSFAVYPYKTFAGRVERVSMNSGLSLQNEKRLTQRGGDIYLHLNSKPLKTFAVDIAMEPVPPKIISGMGAKVKIQVAAFRLVDLILKMGLGSTH